MRNPANRRGSALLYTMLALLALAPAAASAQRAGRGANNPVRNIPVNGVAADGQTFTGELSIQRFQAHGNTLVAVGELSGKFSGGKPVVRQAVSWPVQTIQGVGIGTTTAARTPDLNAVPAMWDPSQPATIVQTQAVCDILNLVLGPLHLDLLGLVVDLNQVVLDITAVQGAGNLLGNLLCAIVGLFDPGVPTPTAPDLAAALTNLVNALNGLIAALPI